jgi:Na+/H+-translocating membrane pyrophosphatase
VDTKRNQQKIKTGVIGLAIFSAIAAWQFYLLVAFKGADGVVDVQGGTIHLWIAIGIGLITSVAVFFFVSSFRRYDRENEMHIASQRRS